MCLIFFSPYVRPSKTCYKLASTCPCQRMSNIFCLITEISALHLVGVCNGTIYAGTCSNLAILSCFGRVNWFQLLPWLKYGKHMGYHLVPKICTKYQLGNKIFLTGKSEAKIKRQRSDEAKSVRRISNNRERERERMYQTCRSTGHAVIFDLSRDRIFSYLNDRLKEPKRTIFLLWKLCSSIALENVIFGPHAAQPRLCFFLYSNRVQCHQTKQRSKFCINMTGGEASRQTTKSPTQPLLSQVKALSKQNVSSVCKAKSS